jgi:hypothetical protein
MSQRDREVVGYASLTHPTQPYSAASWRGAGGGLARSAVSFSWRALTSLVTPANLASASGGQDHTISPSASVPFVRTIKSCASLPRPSHPASRVVTIAHTPLGSRRDGVHHASDLGVASSLFLKISTAVPQQISTTGNLRMALMRNLPVVQSAPHPSVACSRHLERFVGWVSRRRNPPCRRGKKDGGLRFANLTAPQVVPSLRAKRGNPDCPRGDSLDCFVALLLAMASYS